MIFETETRTQAISREQVWKAWKRIRQGGSATGVDGLSIAEIDSKPRKYLYPLWNRMSSGSYFPPAVREVEIPKGDGKTRKLGIPTILDRVAQEVIRAELEAKIEPQFLPDSFAYRPHRSAHQALEQCARHCWERWYVVDIDIKGFFDNLNHEQMMRILEKYTHERHHLLYIKRWLQAPIQQADGRMVSRTKGTPQGGVISPLIANLYLHECFDLWMASEHRNMVYERYADDIVIHTRSREQSSFIMDRLKQRLSRYGLTLNGEKSRIVYCYRTARLRKESKDMPVSFDFLGYTFKPCKCEREDKVRFCGYRPCISTKSRKKILEQIRKMRLHRKAAGKLTAIAKELNPKVKGWIEYYGHFGRSGLGKVFYRLNQRLILWIKHKHKFTGIRQAVRYLRNINKSFPALFVHWEYGFKV